MKGTKLFKLAMALALVVGLVPLVAIPASALTAANFVVSPKTAGATVQVSLNVTLATALASPADTVSVTLSSFTVPATISKSYMSFGGQPLATDPTIVGNTITFLVPDSDGNPSSVPSFTPWAAGTYTVVISQLAGIKNPSVGVFRYRASVVTSQETTSVNSNYVVIIRTASRSPSSGVRGATTTVTGAGFTSGTTANIVEAVAGTADGASAVALLETFGVGDSFTARGVLVGNLVRNISDGSFMIVTSIVTTVTLDDTLLGAAGLVQGNANTWAIGDAYAVELSGPALGSGLVASDGTFTATVTATVPPFAAGSNSLVATDGSGRSATFSFTVNPSVTLNPSSGKTGTIIAVTARDFTGATIASTTVAGAAVVMTPAAPVVTAGAANYTFVVPAGLAGAKSVVVTDSGGATVTTTFTILGSPLTVSPASGVINTRITLSGTGFTPLGAIAANSITFGGAAFTHAAVAIDSGGNFLVALTLSGVALENVASTAGTYTISVVDNGVPALSGAGNFTVPVAGITITPASSPVSSTIVVRGTGFPASTVAIITYNGAPGGTGVVDSTGNFSGTITVPAVAIPSTNTVAAYAITASAVTVPPASTPAQATHSVPSAAIALSATSGNPGTILVVTGTGFPAYSVVTALTIGGIPAIPSPAPATDGMGNVTANVLVPALPAGPAVVAMQIGGVTGSVAFTVGTPTVTPGVALAGIAGSYTRVWGYDAATKLYKLYDPAAPAISDLTSLVRGQGYWILCTQAVTLVYGANSYTLVVGWNLIGWLG